MSENQPIRGKIGNGRKEGRYSTLRRIQSIQSRFNDWRRERSEAHEEGHLPPEIEEGLVAPYLPEGEGTEIVLFTSPLITVRRELVEEYQKSKSERGN